MSPDVRTVTASDYPDWLRAMENGFLTPGAPTDEEAAERLVGTDLSRVLGVFDGGRCVATFRSFTQRLTVVGGATVPADAVSAVTVAPTHRRRGLLSRMMATDLAAARSAARWSPR